jgi:cell division GTPase FtsZ
MKTLDRVSQKTIKIIGVGGGGCQFISHVVKNSLISDMETIAMDTNAKTFERCVYIKKLQLGPTVGRVKGSGGDPEFEKMAAEVSAEEITALVNGSDTIYIVVGGGDGTGGAASVVAHIAKLEGVSRVVAFVQLPFKFSGVERQQKAKTVVEDLRKVADCVIALPNDMLHGEGIVKSVIVPEGIAVSPSERFVVGNELKELSDHSGKANERLMQLVKLDDAIIREKVADPGLARFEQALTSGKDLWVGLGAGVGNRGGFESLVRALNCPVIQGKDIQQSENVLIHMIYGEGGKPFRVEEFSKMVEGFIGVKKEIRVIQKLEPALGMRIYLSMVGC